MGTTTSTTTSTTTITQPLDRSDTLVADHGIAIVIAVIGILVGVILFCICRKKQRITEQNKEGENGSIKDLNEITPFKLEISTKIDNQNNKAVMKKDGQEVKGDSNNDFNEITLLKPASLTKTAD